MTRRRTAVEVARPEEIFEETKNITEWLRLELKEKTQELAPLQLERTLFQNSPGTAQMEVNLLEDTVARAQEQLKSAEKELSSQDGKQKSKRVQSWEHVGCAGPGEGDGGDAADYVVVAVQRQLLVSPDVKETTGCVVRAGGEGESIGEKLE